mmetsp:Transcript_11336/g.29936  ORF Transcript_11336/g.29936 Transcript_11336/m.29936 type:complete len:314 (+) Transcript_11336:3-944(+)
MKASVISNETSLRLAKRPWQEAFSEVKIKAGWAKEGIVPFTRALMWELREEEAQKGVTPSNVPPPDVVPFGLPALPQAAVASTAIIEAPSTALVLASDASDAPWDAGIDEEVERLLRAELNEDDLSVPAVARPAKMPRLTSALLFKLPGGTSGETALALVRAKEVERHLNIARTTVKKKKREEKDARVEDGDWALAGKALIDLKASKFNLQVLKKPALVALVRVLKSGKAVGNKPELRALLVERFGKISVEQFQEIEVAVQRGITRSALRTIPPLPTGTSGVQAALEGPAEAGQPAWQPAQPRALCRPRRGQA